MYHETLLTLAQAFSAVKLHLAPIAPVSYSGPPPVGIWAMELKGPIPATVRKLGSKDGCFLIS